MQLPELQQRLCASLLGEFDERLHECLESDDITAEERLSIYRNTIAGTLTKALRLNFPAVERLVGADFFADCAAGYVRHAPPQSAYLNDFGAGFADYLAQEIRASSLPYLADVARLEWAVSRALVAEAVPAPNWRGLATVDAVLQSEICFRADPSVTLLRLDTPADAIWQAVLTGTPEDLERLNPTGPPVYLLIERLGPDLSVRRLEAPEWAFTKALCSGEPLASVLARHQSVDGQGQLALHLSTARLCAWHLKTAHGAQDS
jgi:hypothetical protein